MPLTKLEHYLVLTDDIDATRDFYVQALGMQIGFRPDLGFPGHWVYVGCRPSGSRSRKWQTSQLDRNPSQL